MLLKDLELDEFDDELQAAREYDKYVYSAFGVKGMTEACRGCVWCCLVLHLRAAVASS